LEFWTEQCCENDKIVVFSE
jgi:hypothetical protein